jgi:hypothetical protein
MNLRRRFLLAAFALVALTMASAGTASADCEVGYSANPLVLISVDFYLEIPPAPPILVGQTLGRGILQALSLQPNCVQLAYVTYTTFPLQLLGVDSPVPYGEFFLSQYLYADNGRGPLAFYPFVAPGVLTVAAIDVTTGGLTQASAAISLVIFSSIN